MGCCRKYIRMKKVKWFECACSDYEYLLLEGNRVTTRKEYFKLVWYLDSWFYLCGNSREFSFLACQDSCFINNSWRVVTYVCLGAARWFSTQTYFKYYGGYEYNQGSNLSYKEKYRVLNATFYINLYK